MQHRICTKHQIRAGRGLPAPEAGFFHPAPQAGRGIPAPQAGVFHPAPVALLVAA
jgi:hypothetical protein